MVKIVGSYTLINTIGQGQYGKVYKATHMESKLQVAIKSIPISKFQEVSKLTQGLKNEVEILKLVEDNPHIIKFLEMIKTSNNIYMVYEFCEGGTLDAYIRRQRFSEAQSLIMMRQLMSAFKVLSSHSIYHRDIKPDNILIKDGKLKLADFGFCKKMGSLDDLTQTVLGSPVYMAPEVLNGDLYNSKADIWSLGVVLYEMLFGTAPFGQGSLSDLVKHIHNFQLKIPTTSATISYETQNLLRRMLTKEHFRRISWEDLFFQYEISEEGVLTRRQKGFQYDLMKLMKKNSSRQSPLQPPKKLKVPINWDAITDRKSSIRSEELESYYKGCDIDKLMATKRELKQLLLKHTKCHQASSVLSQVLKRRYCQGADAVGYLICTIIKNNLQSLPHEISEFRRTNQGFLDSNPQDADKLRKLQFVIIQEKNPLLTKINKLRSSLLGCINHEATRLNDAVSVKRSVREYQRYFLEKYPNCELFDESELNKDITIHLIKVFSVINFQKEKEGVSVNEGLSKMKLAKMLHKRKRDLDI